MSRIVPVAVLLGAVVLSACEGFGQAMTAHTDVVARAAGHELTIDETAALLAQNPGLPAQAEVVDAIANLWVDYVVLATAASRDSTLRSVDLDPLIRPQLDQEIVWKLRDRVIRVDTALTDEQLRTQYERDQPGLEVRARHILLRIPPDATPAQRDSILARARDIQQRAAAGADFAELAREHGEDPSAAQGGDLGFFGRGQMVAPFEEAAFRLREGEVSDLVETPFGIHVIKVEERRMPPFDEARATYRERLTRERQLEAEESYIAELTEPLAIRVQEDALDVARELANKPNLGLAGRAAARPLVAYQGGSFTAGEYQDVMRRFPPGQRARIAGANEEQITQLLEGLARNEILIREARRLGLEVSSAERDSLQQEARRQLEAAADAAGIRRISPQEGETMDQAVDRRVYSLLEAIVRGERDVLPLGPIAYSLRGEYNAEIFERAFPAVVRRVEEIRPAESAAPPNPLQPAPPQPGQPRPVPPQPGQPAPGQPQSGQRPGTPPSGPQGQSPSGTQGQSPTQPQR